MAELINPRPSLMRPGRYVGLDGPVPPPPDLPHWPGVTVSEEVRELLLHHFGGCVSGPETLRAMADYATAHVQRRGIATRVELHPHKRCGCRCTRLDGHRVRHICPRLRPLYRGSHKMVCECRGCERGSDAGPAGDGRWRHVGRIEDCRRLDYGAPGLQVFHDV